MGAKYEAHIYSSSEIQAFFQAVDHCPTSSYSLTRRFVIPVVFRLLYCCGLRSSEARLLRVKDIDLDNGKVVIRESKGWKARTIYLNEDLRELCLEYNKIISAIYPGREAFFPNQKGGFYHRSTLVACQR